VVTSLKEETLGLQVLVEKLASGRLGSGGLAAPVIDAGGVRLTERDKGRLVEKAAKHFVMSPSGGVKDAAPARRFIEKAMAQLQEDATSIRRSESGWHTVRKDDTTAGSAAGPAANSGTPDDVPVVEFEDEGQYKDALEEIAINAALKMQADDGFNMQFYTFDRKAAAEVVELAGELPDVQDFLPPEYLQRLAKAYKAYVKKYKFAKDMGDYSPSFAGESSNFGPTPVNVTEMPLANAAGVEIPVEAVRAPTGPGAVDGMARAATSPTSPAGPAPTAPTTDDDLGTGLTFRFSAVEVAQAIANVQGYEAAASDPQVTTAVTKALKSFGARRGKLGDLSTAFGASVVTELSKARLIRSTKDMVMLGTAAALSFESSLSGAPTTKAAIVKSYQVEKALNGKGGLGP
jgi:hypothetical protein